MILHMILLNLLEAFLLFGRNSNGCKQFRFIVQQCVLEIQERDCKLPCVNVGTFGLGSMNGQSGLHSEMPSHPFKQVFLYSLL